MAITLTSPAVSGIVDPVKTDVSASAVAKSSYLSPLDRFSADVSKTTADSLITEFVDIASTGKSSDPFSLVKRNSTKATVSASAVVDKSYPPKSNPVDHEPLDTFFFADSSFADFTASDNFGVELPSLNIHPSLPAEVEAEAMAVPTKSIPPKPASQKSDTFQAMLKRATLRLYSANSTVGISETVGQDAPSSLVDLGLQAALAGSLALCPEKLEKPVLENISAVRAGFRGAEVVDGMMSQGGLSAVDGAVGLGVGAGVGLIVGGLNAAYLNPKIKRLQERLDNQSKLNQLFTAYLQEEQKDKNGIDSGVRPIPKGLSPTQLTSWFKDRSQFADLERRDIEEADLQPCSQEDTNRLNRLKTSAEIVGSLYAVSIMNTCFDLSGLAGLVSHCVGRAFNPMLFAFDAVYAAFSLGFHYYLAQHQVQGVQLQNKQNYLQAKLALHNNEMKKAQRLPAKNEAQKLTRDLAITKSWDQVQQTTTALQACEAEITAHQQALSEKVQLFEAFWNGFQRGLRAATLPAAAMGLLCGPNPIAHAVIAVFVVFYGVYCGLEQREEKRQELNKARANQAKEVAKPAEAMAVQPTPQPEASLPAQVATKSNKLGSRFWNWFQAKPKPKAETREMGMELMPVASPKPAQVASKPSTAVAAKAKSSQSSFSFWSRSQQDKPKSAVRDIELTSFAPAQPKVVATKSVESPTKFSKTSSNFWNRVSPAQPSPSTTKIATLNYFP